jgi:hypothetical protein
LNDFLKLKDCCFSKRFCFTWLQHESAPLRRQIPDLPSTNVLKNAESFKPFKSIDLIIFSDFQIIVSEENEIILKRSTMTLYFSNINPDFASKPQVLCAPSYQALQKNLFLHSAWHSWDELEVKVLKKSVASPTISVSDKKSSLPISKVKLKKF